LAAAAVEREHQLRTQGLTLGVRRNELLQLGDEVVVAAKRERGFDPCLLSSHAKHLERLCLLPGEAEQLDVSERRSAPERERFRERLVRAFGVARGKLLLTTREQALEAAAIDLFRRDRELVARRARPQRLADELAQLPHVCLHELVRTRRRSLAPELVNRAIGGDNLTRMKSEQGQQRPLLRRLHPDHTPVDDELDRPEQAHLHPSVLSQ